VDRDGGVIDVTWADGAQEYFGVPFCPAYLRAVCPRGPRETLLDRWRDGFPLLRAGTRVREWKETRFDHMKLPPSEVKAWWL
jgi:hypothetical protein